MGKKHILIAALCTAMTLSLAACGNQDTEQKKDSSDAEGYVYVPEYITLDGEDESTWFSNLMLLGNSLYYTQYKYDEATGESTQTVCEYSLADAGVKEIPLQIRENGSLSCYAPDGEGNIYTVVSDYSSENMSEEGWTIPDMFLGKWDSQGTAVFEKDITDAVNRAGENSYIQDVLVDGQGNIYVCAENAVLLFDSAGEEQGMVEISDGWISAIGFGKDEKVYLCYYDYNSNSGGTVLSEIDFAGKKIGNTYKNLPGMNGNGLSVGIEKDFLINDGSRVYEYDLASETYEELFSWLECDINGSYVDYVGTTEDGKLVAVIRDWETGATEIAKLNKTAASEVVQKEEIIIGTLYDSQELQAAAVAFNKANDTYHVSIKTYIDNNNGTENSYQDAITNLNNDITSGANCPDILDLSQLNAEQLAAKGIIEDLTPYLEKSSVFDKEDFIDNLLDGFTYDGVLVAIPTSFTISTVVGKTSEVGEEMGWTLDEMMTFAKAHPDAELFDGIEQSTMLYYCMMYNQDAFVDWANGESHFDSEEFKTLLEFVNMFPQEIDWTSYEGGAKVEERQAGEILLENAYISDFQEVQIYPAMYGEPVTFIGFPTTDGSVGCSMSASSLYGITAKSDQKDGAWAFIESYLSSAGDSMYSWGFSTLKEKMQEHIDEITKVEYLLDENGEQVLDENGEPILTSGGGGIGWEDWEYTYHPSTEEEVELVMELISVATPASNVSNDEILNIITEEADAYFKGQKTLDDVVNIIQSKAQIYISENS